MIYRIHFLKIMLRKKEKKREKKKESMKNPAQILDWSG